MHAHLKYNIQKVATLLHYGSKTIMLCTLPILAAVLLPHFSTAQPNINRVEYYVDNDPGYGNAKPLALVPGQDLKNLSFSVDLTPLKQGVHTVGIRSQDANGAWSLDNDWIFVKAYNNAASQPNITKVEYYVDGDPGYGKATPLSITPGNDLSGIPIAIATAPLYEGIHVVGVRSQDANGLWSLDNHFIFLKPFKASSGIPQPIINRVEYYIDKDPGYGNATALAISPGKDIGNIPININTDALTDGVHVVGIRSLDATGAWSLDNHWVFLKAYSGGASPVQPNITAVEYFIDKDPGYGSATPVTITAGKDLQGIAFDIDLTKVGSGAHKIGVRSKDVNGAWSLDNEFTMTGGSLPVELLSFNAQPEKDDVKVLWSTSQEINSKAFLVQRSTDAMLFETVGTVAAAGNSSTVTNYSYNDVQAMQYRGNVLYYRLKQVDKDNTVKYSGVRKVVLDGSLANTLSLQFNPVVSQAVLLYTVNESGKAQVLVTNQQGQVIIIKEYDIVSGVNTLLLNAGNLAQGIYNIQVMHAKDVQYTRMLKK